MLQPTKPLLPLALIAFLSLTALSARAATTSTTVGAAGHLLFNLTYDTTIDPNALSGFEEAAGRWSSLFYDPVTVNLTVGFQALDAGIIGQTTSSFQISTYSQVRNALTADSKSADDALAVAHLPTGPTTKFLVNYTVQNGDSASYYLDNNGNTDNIDIGITLANAKAMGLRGAGSENDATVIFTSNSNTIPFDFNPDDGITSGQFDFVGAATHEIGHALGFNSSADDVSDGSSGVRNDKGQLIFPVYDENNESLDTMDLFRYSVESVAQGGFDITADTRTKYFSLDGGVTQVSSNSIFADGTYNGDGRQASHWKDNIGAGIMDPTAAPGELLAISSNDVRLFDAIGYDITPAPEPSSLFVMALGSLGLLGCVFVRRQRAAMTG